MLQHIPPTDWHQIFLVAAGFLTAILFLWIQSEQRFFYAEDKFDREALLKRSKETGIDIKRRLSNRRISYSLWRLWLYAGVLFALLAFGFTGLHWLVAGRTIQCSLAACLVGQMQQLAAGFLMGAFDITLIAVLKTVFLDLLFSEYRKTESWIKEGKGEEPLDYGSADETRRLNKRCLFLAVCIALFLILISCLLPAIIQLSPSYWLCLALYSVLIPGLILLLTLLGIKHK